MTREEEIIKEASEYADDPNNLAEWGDGWEDYNDFDQVFDAFKNGAKWADRTMLDKVCEWLKENVRVFQKEDIGDFILANLRKEMMK